MAERNRAAVHIDQVRVPRHLLVDRTGLRGKGFVSFHKFKVVYRPARFSERGSAGRDRARSHDAGVNPGCGPGNDSGKRCDPAVGGCSCTHQNSRCCPVIEARRIAGGHAALFIKGGPQTGETLHCGAMTRMLIGIHDRIALAALDRDRNYLIVETAGLLRRLSFLLRRGRKGILHLAGNAELRGNVLGSIAHVVSVKHIQQAVYQHGVDHLKSTELLAVAKMGAVRCLAHALLSARHDDVGIFVADRLIARSHRAKA